MNLPSWTPDRARHLYNRAVAQVHIEFRDAGREWSGQHFATMVRDAREAVWDGPEVERLRVFDEIIEEIKMVLRASPARSIFDIQPIIEEIRSTILSPPCLSTGLPGAPTKGRELLIAELERRLIAGEVADMSKANGDVSPTQASEALVQWYGVVHPDASQPKAASVANSIRERIQRYNSHGCEKS